MKVAVTGIGLRCALGNEPGAVLLAWTDGVDGLVAHAPLSNLPDGRAGVVSDLGLRAWLKRRKDKKLMARPAQLALPAFGEALGDWSGGKEDLGLFLGVGREPPDDGASEEALSASVRDGHLDEQLLAGPGRDRYPPLLPLRTLPNMALAHASIHLDIQGENGAWAGDEDAGVSAMRAGFHAIVEGRAPAALVGAADSKVDLGSARDRLRRGRPGLPGEAAAALLLEPAHTTRPVLAWLDLDAGGKEAAPLLDLLGDCGAALPCVAAVLAVAAMSSGGSGASGSIRVGGRRGVRVSHPGAC